ncbi:MAG TPA: SDR family oxidoreductase [Gaiellaceae bacterium]|nr:SDR family oxidoreductase [Gaiellaceae bacterium]
MRTAVVTGGSSGIGEATARLLAAEGWRCVLLARGRERLERVAAEIGADWDVCDVGDRAQVETAAARVGERTPAVDLLVSCAGIPGGGGFLDLPPERIEEITRTNYLGSVWALRAFLPLLEAASSAHVVNVASVAGVYAVGASGPYSASKHAQLAFSRAAAVELAPRGIRVHAVNPGPVRTEGFPQDRLRGTRLDRFVLPPERVARTILRTVERDRPESFVFGAYRVAGLVQAALPGTLSRLAQRRRGRGASQFRSK